MVLYDGARITPKPPHRPLEKNAAILFVFSYSDTLRFLIILFFGTINMINPIRPNCRGSPVKDPHLFYFPSDEIMYSG